MSPDEILHAQTDSGYRGAFTFEADSALRPAKYRLSDRRRCPGDKRLASPTLEMQIRLEKRMFEGTALSDTFRGVCAGEPSPASALLTIGSLSHGHRRQS